MKVGSEEGRRTPVKERREKIRKKQNKQNNEAKQNHKTTYQKGRENKRIKEGN